jgi:protein ImuB
VRVVPEGAAAAFLAPLPVTTLADADLVGLLLRLGVRTLGEFAALPVEHVSGRFGAAGARLHALASGLDSRSVAPRTPPPEFDSAIDFEPPLDRIDQVAFGFRTRADEFIERLVAAKLVCTAVLVETWSESGERVERTWLHPRSFTAADVVDRVRWQLQGDSGLGSGVTRVRVSPGAVDAIGNHEQGLWGTGHDERIHHGLSRVQSMLGHGAVLTASVGDGRMLAERVALVPWGDRARPARPGPWPGRLPPPLPATVFAPPRSVDVVGENGEAVAVDGRGILSSPPVRFSPTGSARELRPVRAWAGPWPIEERWWDAAARRRANRFQVVDDAGVAWLLVLERGGWWAEARYD